jgi:hypothetical protein
VALTAVCFVCVCEAGIRAVEWGTEGGVLCVCVRQVLEP